MKKNLLRQFLAVVAVGSSAGIACGQYGPAAGYGQSSTYRAPARWSQFRAVGDDLLDSGDSLIENLPAPIDQKSSSDRGLLLDGPQASPQARSSSQARSGGQSLGGRGNGEMLPTPTPDRKSDEASDGGYRTMPAPKAAYPAPQAGYGSSTIYGTPYPNAHHGLLHGGAACEPTATLPVVPSAEHASPYATAMQSNWGGVPACGPVNARPDLYPWFGGANLLFLQLEGGKGMRIFDNYPWTTSIADPDPSLGYDLTFGRYLGCGRYGLGITYFNWNPDDVSAVRDIPAGTPGSSMMPFYYGISYNDGTGENTYEQHIDGSAAAGTGLSGVAANTVAATAARVNRDLQFQSIEANLFSFGLMGAQRHAYAGCPNVGPLAGRHADHYGFGGATGPLARSSGGRVRVMTSHGFRWFQAKDEIEYAYNVDGVGGYGVNDLYDQFEVENNLFGYQFGSRLTYCLGRGFSANVGGKVGLYGNHVEARHYMGSLTTDAYVTGDNTNRINRRESDTVLASLAELDLGLGYNINQAWTFTGGYRLIGMMGVANAVDSYPNHFDHTCLHIDADKSYLLHGAYVGLNFNW
ncbi:MAG: BBP7 family outer membrane beta-barrel protein [Planctomycetota bacterium]